MEEKCNFKETMGLIGEALSDVSKILIEKNKIRAQCSRIKQIIKGDTNTRNNAYAELGKFYYMNCRENATKENEELCALIDKMNARIEKASLKYLELQTLQNNTKIQSENTEKLKAAVAESAEQAKQDVAAKAKEYGAKASEFATEKWDQAKAYATNQYEKVKSQVDEKTQEIKDKATDTVGEIKEKAENIKEDIKDKVLVKEENVDKILDEESPDSFEF